MTIRLNQGEEKYLLHCVYLGVLMVNGNRKNGEQREEYNEFAENIYKQVCGKEEITDNEVAGIRSRSRVYRKNRFSQLRLRGSRNARL